MGCWLRPYCKKCTENEEAVGLSPWHTKEEKRQIRAGIPVVSFEGLPHGTTIFDFTTGQTWRIK